MYTSFDWNSNGKKLTNYNVMIQNNCILACIYLFVVLSNDTNMNISDFRHIRETFGNVSSSTCAFYQILVGLISFEPLKIQIDLAHCILKLSSLI